MTKNEQMDTIKNVLAVLQPAQLEIVDESHKHEGHGGWRDGVVTHIHIKIASPLLDPLPRLARHRKVMELLAPMMPEPLHAARLSISGCN